MRQFLATILFGFILNSTAMASERPEVGRYLKVYSGGDGVIVKVLRIGPRAANEALVQIIGIDDELDGRIRKVRVQVSNSGLLFLTSGTEQRVLAIDAIGIELFAPVYGGRLRMNYDPARSEQAVAQHFLTDFLDQK